MNIRAIFFDVANTLLHKPDLVPAISSALVDAGLHIPEIQLRTRHRQLSEIVAFPDRTSRSFYDDFNSMFLRSFGILPRTELLDRVFTACSGLPWRPFDDVGALKTIPFPLGVLSNWDSALATTLPLIEDVHFSWVFGSEDTRMRKPDMEFFQHVLDSTGCSADEIVYVGDSLRLDIEPAVRIGMSAYLIDREDLYPQSNVPRITSLEQLMDRL
jgi:FMN phosphatase YigB (HAD superfamily)